MVVVIVACGGKPTATSTTETARPAAEVGTPVPDLASEALVKDTIVRLAGGDTTAAANLGETFLIGGGLWPEIVGTEKSCCPAKELYTLGTKSFIAYPDDPTKGWEARTFLDGNHRKALVGLKPFVTLVSTFKDAKVRPAEENERKMFHALYPMEIAGKPLTIIEHAQGVKLIVFVEDAKIVVLDGLIGYSESTLVKIEE